MLIVSHSLKLIYINFFYYLVSSGVPIVPFTPKKLKEKTENENQNDLNKEKEIINNDGEKNEKNITNNGKMLPTVFVPTSLIINPILNPPKSIYNNKYQKNKQKPFMERNGDWICKKCKNLNFSFRHECNRCKLPKKEVIETEEKKEENNNQNNKHNGYNYYKYNNIQQYNKKNKYRFKKYS